MLGWWKQLILNHRSTTSVYCSYVPHVCVYNTTFYRLLVRSNAVVRTLHKNRKQSLGRVGLKAQLDECGPLVKYSLHNIGDSCSPLGVRCEEMQHVVIFFSDFYQCSEVLPTLALQIVTKRNQLKLVFVAHFTYCRPTVSRAARMHALFWGVALDLDLRHELSTQFRRCSCVPFRYPFSWPCT